uniref:Uncharacterized protein n=1 Tax=Rhizophagus irregularis (strain DAOM 181602 / DAOM 197198 / MUCL 43194) TaxID=747089 RepID=U9SRW1_RHIID
MIILMACLTGYLVVVIIDVKQDSPIIATSFNNVDAVPLPGMHFLASYNFSITSCHQFYFVDGNIRAVECSLEDTKVYYDETTKAYFGVYTPSPNVLFNDLMKSLLLILTINEDFTPGITQEMTLHAFDSEYDIYYKNLSELSVYDNSILTLNRYSVEPSQIKDSANTLRPWGAVQSYCCGFSRSTQKKLKDALPIIPFFDTTHNDNFKNYSPDRELSLAERNELRISGLELFLQEYVVDVHYLDGIRKTTLNSTTNTINDQEAQNMKEEFDNINTNTTHSTESTVTQQQEGFVPPNFTQNSTSNNFTSVKYD